MTQVTDHKHRQETAEMFVTTGWSVKIKKITAINEPEEEEEEMSQYVLQLFIDSLYTIALS